MTWLRSFWNWLKNPSGSRAREYAELQRRMGVASEADELFYWTLWCLLTTLKEELPSQVEHSKVTYSDPLGQITTVADIQDALEFRWNELARRSHGSPEQQAQASTSQE